VSELITHMPSYHCSDNVSIEWNQAFRLNVIISNHGKYKTNFITKFDTTKFSNIKNYNIDISFI
jgi:hypothetical protein